MQDVYNTIINHHLFIDCCNIMLSCIVLCIACVFVAYDTVRADEVVDDGVVDEVVRISRLDALVVVHPVGAADLYVVGAFE